MIDKISYIPGLEMGRPTRPKEIFLTEWTDIIKDALKFLSDRTLLLPQGRATSSNLSDSLKLGYHRTLINLITMMINFLQGTDRLP
jgi:hypothetical protein